MVNGAVNGIVDGVVDGVVNGVVILKLNLKSRLQNLEKATPPVIRTKYGTIIGKNVKISTPNQDLDPVTQVKIIIINAKNQN